MESDFARVLLLHETRIPFRETKTLVHISEFTVFRFTPDRLDWKPPKQFKCAYTQPIPHTNKKLSSLIAL